MKYHISREQHFFFEKNHFIEFEELLTEQEHVQLLRGIHARKQERYNLSITSQDVQKIAFLPRLARLAGELIGKRQLRFGFDRLIEPPFPEGSLQDKSCISPLLCALLYSLDSAIGHGVFFSPAAELSTLPQEAMGHYFLLAWADPRGQYLFHEGDPYTHELKSHGYVFGDRLQEKSHPIIIR